MKRLLILLLIALTLTSLASCELLEALDALADGGAGSSTTGETEEEKKEELKDEEKEKEDETVPGLILDNGIAVAIIKPAGDTDIDINPFLSTLRELTGKTAIYIDDSAEYPGRQIVLGDTKLAVSNTAKAKLETEIQKAIANYEASGVEIDRLDGCLVYSNGTAVALVWTDPSVTEDTISYFMEKYLSSAPLVLEDGYVEFVPFNKKEMIIAAEKVAREAAYSKALEMYGSEVVAAIDAHLDLFGEDFYLWLAGLYEKSTTDLSGKVIGGGFYYSNSARDNTSYAGVKLLPDLESTSQVLTFMQKSGMLQSVTLIQALPEEMRQQIIDFARALQSSTDGYFYHPQWGTSINTSRRSRDCGWGATILTRLGVKPYWNTPSGTSGMYGAPGSKASSALLLPVGSSTAQSASRLVLTANVWTGASHLATLSAWESYLIDKTKNMASDSYTIGNTLSSQNSQIREREKLAIQNGELSDPDRDGIADGGYIRTIERILNEKQQDNGLWETSASYNAINGLMKIAGIYSNLGLAMNNADKALLAAISTIDEDANPDHITYVYNAWSAVNSLLNNLAKHGNKEKSDELRAMIKEKACEMITATTAQVRKFKKSDGSFGYTQNIVPYKSQGEIAAVFGTVEGDVNGGTIAFTGIWGSMCSVLEIEILPFGYENLLEFVAAIDYER